MKKLIATFFLAAGIAISALAQEKKDTIKVNPDAKIKKAAKSVGNKTAEVAIKGAAKITDKKYKDKVGPQGQTIYIDNHAKFYYVNNQGTKIYVSEEVLVDKQ